MYNKQLKFRADEEIKNKLLLKSKLLNISYAEYLRLLILDDEKRNFIGEIIEFKNVLRELKIELNYIGNNLNQLSKKVNSNANIQLDEVLKVQENLSNISLTLIADIFLLFTIFSNLSNNPIIFSFFFLISSSSLTFFKSFRLILFSSNNFFISSNFNNAIIFRLPFF